MATSVKLPWKCDLRELRHFAEEGAGRRHGEKCFKYSLLTEIKGGSGRGSSSYRPAAGEADPPQQLQRRQQRYPLPAAAAAEMTSHECQPGDVFVWCIFLILTAVKNVCCAQMFTVRGLSLSKHYPS